MIQVLNWLYQSNEVVGSGQLDARIQVYDGRLWVDRGGTTGGQSTTDEDSSTAEPDGAKNSRHLRGPSLTTATMSQLLVDKAQMFHSGRYVCSALGASGTWTLVHILAGKKANHFLLFLLLC